VDVEATRSKGRPAQRCALSHCPSRVALPNCHEAMVVSASFISPKAAA
jgi:hypothetical protein